MPKDSPYIRTTKETLPYTQERRDAVIDEYVASHTTISIEEEAKVIEVLRANSPLAYCWVGIYCNMHRCRALAILELLRRKGIVKHEHFRSPLYSLASQLSAEGAQKGNEN